MRYLKVVTTGLVAIAFLAMVWGSSPVRAAAVGGTSPAAHPSSSPSVTSTIVRARKVGNLMVLTNARGLTLYSFSLDTPTTSKCNGTCARVWPPLKGPATAGPGVTGKLGTIKRSDGSTQATYNGHPLYTFHGDTRPGQDMGNNLKLSGGVWHVVPVSGMAVPAPSAMRAAGGGGY